MNTFTPYFIKKTTKDKKTFSGLKLRNYPNEDDMEEECHLFNSSGYFVMIPSISDLSLLNK